MVSWESLCQDYQVDSSAFLTYSSYSGIISHGDHLDLHAKQDTTNKYYARLLEKYKENTGITELIISEQKAWLEYYKSTSEAYSMIVLGKSSCQFKSDYLKNYKIAICEHRIMALQSMWLEDISVWNFNDTCRWDEVGYEYDRIEKCITRDKSLKNYFPLSLQLQILKLDKSRFHKYLNSRFELANKVNFYDENCVLHYKSVILGKMLK